MVDKSKNLTTQKYQLDSLFYQNLISKIGAFLLPQILRTDRKKNTHHCKYITFFRSAQNLIAKSNKIKIWDKVCKKFKSIIVFSIF